MNAFQRLEVCSVRGTDWYTLFNFPLIDFVTCYYKLKRMRVNYLIQSHAEQEQHHIDDFVHDYFPLETDKEEHSSTNINPILHKHCHHHVP